MTKEKRTELETLSKLLKGTKSYYKKLQKPQLAEFERTLEDGTVQKYKGYLYPTVEQAEARMRDEFTKKLAEEQIKKQEELNVGSRTDSNTISS
jgi:hypothetical protein